MGKLLTAIPLAAAMIMSAYPASADGYYSYKSKHYSYGGGHYGYKGHYRKYDKRSYRHRHHRRHGDIGDEILLGAGIIGGAIIVGSVLSRPRPAPPPQVVYYAPPPAPYCVQDQVYRYLPDGRIQWGTRTRCY